MHPVRPRGTAGRQPPARASPDHAAARLGRARRRRDPRARPDVRPDRAAGSRRGRRGRSPRSGSATSARRPSSGTDGPGGRSITRSSGRTRGRPMRWRGGWRPRGEAGGAATASGRPTGLPISTYSCALKLRWILESRRTGIRRGRGDLLFGTIDCWLIWQLTGGVDGGVHVTDVTNASRTMLMDLDTLDWDGCSSTSSASHARCCRRSAARPRSTAAGSGTSMACRSPGSSATSTRRCSGRRASRRARRNARTGPARSC